jgi:phosphodiesterase/alkaline phosphatase D-like protein
MKNMFVMATMALALGSWCFAQDSGGDRNQKPQVLIITNGPVVENVTDTTAQIAWSTNVSSSTIVHYGMDPLQLNGAASMPWGALTHRVQLKNLKPNTMYYFRVESGQGQGTGTDVQAAESAFQTKPAPAQSNSNHEGASRSPILYWPPFFAAAALDFCMAASRC